MKGSLHEIIFSIVVKRKFKNIINTMVEIIAIQALLNALS
jgi:hypothetical protein